MLPSDRYIAEILGLTEAQYRHFQIEARKHAAEGPQPAVVGATTVTAASQVPSTVTYVLNAKSPYIP